MRMLKSLALRIMVLLRLYPHKFMIFQPKKIYEFDSLLEGVRFGGRETILDLGCGSGILTLLIGRHCGNVVGVDVLESSIRKAERLAGRVKHRINSSFHCGKLEEAGFAEGSFDRAFSFCVIEHIPNYEQVIREVYRVLKPGGEFIFSVDAVETIDDPEVIKRHMESCQVQRYFKDDELRGVLKEAGFTDIRVSPLFCSDCARMEFLHCLDKGWDSYRFPSNILGYWKLKREEKSCKERDKGLALVARCRKPLDVQGKSA